LEIVQKLNTFAAKLGAEKKGLCCCVSPLQMAVYPMNLRRPDDDRRREARRVLNIDKTAY
jgi:hypothetical protein